MNFTNLVRRLGTKLVVGAALLAAPAASFAGIFVSVSIAPPILPVYAQPICPGDGYIWTPGYWAYGPEGYYWIPGTWVMAPTPGFLWTPAYWGFENGLYLFHEGYWGPHVGFYGGINYGFGYFGHGFEGGYWDHDRFFYNHAYNNINPGIVHNVYVKNVTVVNNYNRVAFNGGAGGVQARPLPYEMQAMHERHEQPTSMQQQHFQAAAQDRGQLFNANHGQPAAVAVRTPQEYHNQVNQRQGDMQGRFNGAGRPGQLTPGDAGNAARGAAQQQQQGRPMYGQQPQSQMQQTRPQYQQPSQQPQLQQRPQYQQQAPQQQPQSQMQQSRPQYQQQQPQLQQRPQYQQQPQAQPQARPQYQQPVQQPRPQVQPQPVAPPQQRPQVQPQAAPRQEAPARQEAPRQGGGERGGERPRG